jgi:hypothetical protein
MTLETYATRIPPSPCPYCDHVYDVTSSIGERATPQPGNWAVCYNCAQFLIYDDDLRVRKPQRGEVTRMTQQHPKTRRLMDQAAAFIRRRDRRGLA